MSETTNNKTITKISLDAVLDEREEQNGEFEVVSAISQELKEIFRKSKNYLRLNSMQRESIEMILHKVARICSGDPNHKDHWVDISGYSQLVAETLKD